MYPLRIYLQHVYDQIGSALRAIDWAALPISRQVSVMVRMCMPEISPCQWNRTSRQYEGDVRQEVCRDVGYGSVAESVDGNGHPLEDFIEWRLATTTVRFGWAEVSIFDRGRLFPSFVLLIGCHERGEDVVVGTDASGLGFDRGITKYLRRLRGRKT